MGNRPWFSWVPTTNRLVHSPVTHLSLLDLSASKPAWATSTEISQTLGEFRRGVRLQRVLLLFGYLGWFAPILPTTESPT